MMPGKANITCGRRERALYRMGPAAACLLIAMLLGACAGPESRPAVALMQMRLPLQDFVQVHLFSVTESFPGGEAADFPAVGFRFEKNHLVPSAEPGSAAGVRMSAKSFAEWQRVMAQSGLSLLYIDPVLVAQPGRNAEVRTQGTFTYVQNVEMRRGRSAMAHQGDIAVGTKVSLSVQPTPDPETLLVDVDVFIRNAEADSAVAAEGDSADDAFETGPLKLDLPRIVTRHIRAAVPLRYGVSAIVAHYARQRPASAAGTGGPVAEHMVCVVTAVRTGKTIVPDEQAAPLYDKKDHCAATLLCTVPAQTPGGGAVPVALSQPLTADELGECTEHLKRLGEMPVIAGVTAVPGRPAGFEMTTAHSYLGGIAVPPGNEASGPYMFVVRRQLSGTQLDVRLTEEASGGSLSLDARHAAPPTMVPLRRREPSFRALVELAVQETYLTHICRQTATEIACILPSVSSGTYRLECKTKTTGASSLEERQAPRESLGLLTLRPLRQVQEAAEAGESSDATFLP